MGAVKFDVYALTPDMASTLCRFCMKQEQMGEPHYKLDWYKWPNSEVTRLFEQVIGQQLPVSAQLSEQFCSSCHWWLKEANEKIKLFQEIDILWRTFLSIHQQQSVDPDNESLKNEIPAGEVMAAESEMNKEEQFLDDDCYKVEYLDMNAYTEEDDEDAPAVTEGDGGDIYNDFVEEELIDCIEYEVTDDPIEDALPASTAKSTTKQIVLNKSSTNWNSHGETSVECDLCGHLDESKETLLEHFRNQHDLYHQYSCKVCPIVFPSIEKLISHTKIHPLQTLECCGREFANRRLLLRHKRSIHSPATPMACPECAKVFASKAKLYNHMQRHGEKKHICDKCDRSFHLKKDLKVHELTIHQQIRRFKCDQCGHDFSTKVSALRHQSRCGSLGNQRRLMRNSGTTSTRPRLCCSECDFRCMRPETLERHFTKEHSDCDWETLKQCLCIKCLRQFDTVEQLAEHREKHHPTLQCDICKAILSSEVSLERHKRIHTAKERPFTCPICQGTYVTQHQLKMHHRRKHTDERPFACPVCDRRYAERSEMNVHIRSAHNDGRRFPCTECPNTYNSAKYLAMHVAQMHTGDFNFFECPTCKWRFVNTRLLGEHQAVHHPVLSD